MQTTRQLRIAAEVAKIVSFLLRNEVKDRRFERVMVSDVWVSKDLAYVTVYVDVAAEESKEHQAEIMGALNKASAWFQRTVGKELQLRVMPKIKFTLDDSIQQASEIDILLKEARKQLS